MDHSFFTDKIAGQELYRCQLCKHDTFDSTKAREHSKNMHSVLSLPEMETSLPVWLGLKPKLKPGIKLGFGLITWNTASASWSAAGSIHSECIRLKGAGVLKPDVIWVDNGSTDDTIPDVKGRWNDFDRHEILLDSNKGQSYGRNLIIRKALDLGLEYLIMLDGDIEMVPFSSYAFLRFMVEAVEKQANVGCLGMYSPNCSPVLEDTVARTCRKIEGWMTSGNPRIAWTNYGIFDMEVFRQGIEFDEDPCFMGPGWGLEDDDLYLQMQDKGFQSLNTPYFRHLHRKRHSSLYIMDRHLAAKCFAERKSYMLSKWGHKGVIHGLAGMNLPVLS